MKHWPSQLFPLIMLSVLAALTFWLQSATAPGDEKHDGKFRHDPDAIAENYVVRRFDETGTVKYRLTGPYMVHYPDDDTTDVTRPHLTTLVPGKPRTQVSSDTGQVNSDGSEVQLTGNVHLIRDGEKGNPPHLSVADYRVQKVKEAEGFAEMLGGKAIVFDKQPLLEVYDQALDEIVEWLKRHLCA